MSEIEYNFTIADPETIGHIPICEVAPPFDELGCFLTLSYTRDNRGTRTCRRAYREVRDDHAKKITVATSESGKAMIAFPDVIIRRYYADDNRDEPVEQVVPLEYFVEVLEEWRSFLRTFHRRENQRRREAAD